MKRHYIIKTARTTIPYVQPEMKFRSPPGQFHHEPPLFSVITEVPTITAFVAAFDAKALNFTELLKSWLAGTGLLTATGKPTEIATMQIFDTIHGLRFL